jgi:hypothetical protein
MPSVSKSQQRLMGMAYSVKKGDTKLSDIDSEFRDTVKNLVDSMTLKQLKDFAETKHDNLPETVPENLSLGDIGGMGAITVGAPNSSEIGSGDVPAGRKKKKKKKKKVKSLKEFIEYNKVNEGKIERDMPKATKIWDELVKTFEDNKNDSIEYLNKDKSYRGFAIQAIFRAMNF